MSAAAKVVHFAGARRVEKLPERLDEIVAVDVVAHLFPLVAENAVGFARHGAFHQVGEEARAIRYPRAPGR